MANSSIFYAVLGVDEEPRATYKLKKNKIIEKIEMLVCCINFLNIELAFLGHVTHARQEKNLKYKSNCVT